MSKIWSSYFKPLVPTPIPDKDDKTEWTIHDYTGCLAFMPNEPKLPLASWEPCGNFYSPKGYLQTTKSCNFIYTHVSWPPDKKSYQITRQGNQPQKKLLIWINFVVGVLVIWNCSIRTKSTTYFLSELSSFSVLCAQESSLKLLCVSTVYYPEHTRRCSMENLRFCTSVQISQSEGMLNYKCRNTEFQYLLSRPPWLRISPPPPPPPPRRNRLSSRSSYLRLHLNKHLFSCTKLCYNSLLFTLAV